MGECYDKALSGIFIIIICIPLVLQMVYTITGRQYDLPLVGGAGDTQVPKNLCRVLWMGEEKNTHSLNWSWC